MRLILLLLFLSGNAFADEGSGFRDPVDFLRKTLVDLRLGPGYLAYENIRRKGREVTGSQRGADLLYDLRIGPVHITNIFNRAGFTRGRKFRWGLLVNYTGDEYEAEGLSKRKKRIFGGGFAGYNWLTLYFRSELNGKSAGLLYNARFAPRLLSIGKRSEFFLILEAEHMNRLYVDYYFGVREGEATAILPRYAGKRSTNYSATLLYAWQITKRLEFTFWGGEKRFGPGVTRSPTVGLKHQYRAGAGLLFEFL